MEFEIDFDWVVTHKHRMIIEEDSKESAIAKLDNELRNHNVYGCSKIKLRVNAINGVDLRELTQYQFCTMSSISIEGVQSLFCGYEVIQSITPIKLNNEQDGMFIECGTVFKDLLGGLIERELSLKVESGIELLVSVIPLVTFREHISLLLALKSYLSYEELNFFKYLFEETKTWKSKGCDLVCISGAKIAEEGMWDENKR